MLRRLLFNQTRLALLSALMFDLDTQYLMKAVPADTHFTLIKFYPTFLTKHLLFPHPILHIVNNSTNKKICMNHGLICSLVEVCIRLDAAF